jgi:hypothetical protein
MARLDEITVGKFSGNTDRVGTLESIFAGVVSGAIAIPKGFFSLGATLIDLGAGTNKAAEVEAFFDDLTDFDEKAEATAAGKLTETLVNIGIPGGVAFKAGSRIAKQAMAARSAGTYFKPSKEFVDVAKGVGELNAKGRRVQFLAGAGAGGVAEGVFVGDVEGIGTFGDLLGGPTQINREEDQRDPARQLINRIKFGTEGALFTGLLGGLGNTIKKLATRSDDLAKSHTKFDQFLYKIATGLRARGKVPEEFFSAERIQVGERSADLVGARNISRELDQDIDKLFPPFKTIANKQTARNRDKLLAEMNDVLLSGEPTMNAEGAVTFGKINKEASDKLVTTLKKYGATDETVTSILGNFSVIRGKWGDMFTKLGKTASGKDLALFKELFGDKVKGWLGATYDRFQNKSVIPYLAYKPTRQVVEKAMKVFQEAAEEGGNPITKEEAEYFVNNVLKTAKLPGPFRMDRPSDPLFSVPDFFINRTSGNTVAQKYVSLDDFTREADKEVFEELLGKTKNPMQTILGGTSRLSLITRRNEFFDNLIKINDDLVKAGKQPFLVKTQTEATRVFGPDQTQGFRRINMDPNKVLEAASTNPLMNAAQTKTGQNLGYFTTDAIADALEKTNATNRNTGAFMRVYENLFLYPKATSQIAKTILSPVTHLRNFISAGAFAAANGIIPAVDTAAVKSAYQALQTPLKGTRQQNEFYEKLLRLGVVNSNVRLGDLTRLLEDVRFGETMTSDRGMRLLLKPLSKLKQASQDLYTAEDDFWKIYSWSQEKKRIGDSLIKAGIKKGDEFTDAAGNTIKFTDDYLEQEAANIVKNNIPNYDYVGEFIKGLRKFPIGNFVSFPAEILRTGTNIVRRGLKEVNYTVTRADGTVVKPFQAIGHTRLFGFGATTVAVPYATVEMFKALYDVTEEEMEAIKRYVPDWSKNSTIVPIRTEDGKLKYVDFSHANAYDTLTRPVQTVLNAVAEGRTDEDGIMDDFLAGLFTATKELGEPFVSESIWTEAAADIIGRGGRTRSGSRIYNDLDTPGDKAQAIMKHLVEAQMPFSAGQINRIFKAGLNEIDITEKGRFDKYGQVFELSDEMAGLVGFRAVQLNPERSLNFKIADYQKGVRDSRSLFTAKSLRGGPIDARDIVQNYINANRALYQVRQEFQKDIDGARVLGISEGNLYNTVTDRISRIDFATIDNDQFRPLAISTEVQQAFAENAAAIGVDNPYLEAAGAIAQVQGALSALRLSDGDFPLIENPLLPESFFTGPSALNLGNIDQQTLSKTGQNNSLQGLTTAQKLAILFPN